MTGYVLVNLKNMIEHLGEDKTKWWCYGFKVYLF